MKARLEKFSFTKGKIILRDKDAEVTQKIWDQNIGEKLLRIEASIFIFDMPCSRGICDVELYLTPPESECDYRESPVTFTSGAINIEGGEAGDFAELWIDYARDAAGKENKTYCLYATFFEQKANEWDGNENPCGVLKLFLVDLFSERNSRDK